MQEAKPNAPRNSAPLHPWWGGVEQSFMRSTCRLSQDATAARWEGNNSASESNSKKNSLGSGKGNAFAYSIT